ncbi:MAG: Crp/Fnr family transcriptional regulator [Bacteroidia bacterium]
MSDLIKTIKENFPAFENELVEYLAQKGSIKTYKAGEQLIRSGQYIKSTMLITKGRIKLYTNGEDGDEFFMYYLEPGQACALSFVCAARNRKSDIEAFAKEDSEVISIPIELMDELMIKFKTWYYFVIETYRNRYQELLDVIRSVAFHAMDERLEYYLIKQKNALGTNTLSITHEQVATDLNSSRVVISRLLKQLEQKGKLKLHRNAIELIF